MNDPVVQEDKDNRPLYNSRIIDAYCGLLRKRYPHVDITALLQYAGMEPYQVADQGRWFTQKQINLFHERVVQLSQNESIALEAGRYAASPDVVGVMRQYALGLVGPAHAYALLGPMSKKFTRSAIYESKKIGPNKVEITIIPHEGVKEQPFQCQNRIGFFEALIRIFNYRQPTISHPECAFQGATRCRYIVSWESSLASLWQKIRNYSILLLSIATIVSLVLKPTFGFTHFLPVAAVMLFVLTFIADAMEKKELQASLDAMMGSTEQLVEQLNINNSHALLTNEIGQALRRQNNVEGILASVVEILRNRLDYSRGMILLANPQKTHLEYRSGFGYGPEEEKLLRKTSFNLRKKNSRGVFVLSFLQQKPFLINNIEDIEGDLSLRSLALARRLGARSFICCPILSENDPIGILAVDNQKSQRPLIESDISLLMGIAPVIGISIQNVKLLNARSEQFKSTLQALAASIDARDPLTAGHSQAVTEYALGICRELQLDSDFQETIRVAALLHDYGKIGVPDAILKKQGRLTVEEYEIVKTHTEKTRHILEQINFEGIFREVPRIAGAHHEKMDGSGYPEGLKGEQIPLGARIIAVADFFEAITAERHYREPMPLDVAVTLLKKGSGIHFDPQVVTALLNYYFKTHLETTHLDMTPVSASREPRIPCKTQVSVTGRGFETIGCGADLSLGGVYVVSDTALPEGQEVEIRISLPGHNGTTVTSGGRIVWANSGRLRRKPLLPAGFGIEFRSMSTTDRKILRRHLLSLDRPEAMPVRDDIRDRL